MASEDFAERWDAFVAELEEPWDQRREQCPHLGCPRWLVPEEMAVHVQDHPEIESRRGRPAGVYYGPRNDKEDRVCQYAGCPRGGEPFAKRPDEQWDRYLHRKFCSRSCADLGGQRGVRKGCMPDAAREALRDRAIKQRRHGGRGFARVA